VASTALRGAHIKDALWNATACARAYYAPLDGDADSEVVIVGGGYTGLSAALHLAELGINARLLEAHSVGFGASGRNTGEVVPGWSVHSPAQIDQRFGIERGNAMNQWVRDSAALVFELIDAHDIDCDVTRSGWLMPASNQRRLAVACAKHDQWAERAANVSMLGAEETRAVTGSEHYIGAWLHRDGGTIQPLSYARGLARAAAAAGAHLHEQTAVTALRQSNDGWTLQTATGSVRAKRVVLATNAYDTALNPALARLVVPLRLFQTATTPLGDNTARSILPQGHGISDSRRVLWAFRKDRFNRLITGVTPLSTTATHAQMRAMAQHQLRTVFPQIAAPEIEYFWNGVVAVTLDRLPRFVELNDNLYAGLGYSGRGIAMATGMGKLLAQRSAGTPAAELALPLSPLKPLPMHRLLAPLARTRAWWWRQRDLWEDRT